MKTQEQTDLTTYSDRIMKTLYSTKVTATGGRHGHIRSEDGLLDMKLALPRQLGGKGDATNPETLFAGGYAVLREPPTREPRCWAKICGRRGRSCRRGRSRSQRLGRLRALRRTRDH